MVDSVEPGVLFVQVNEAQHVTGLTRLAPPQLDHNHRRSLRRAIQPPVVGCRFKPYCRIWR